ncbi:hypothetical protein ScalyP_jg9634 [Parmales sp. scaly parma]|nr:hypothetical protein ScalyP_jg9634 [Parmales sp. scaly parma]
MKNLIISEGVHFDVQTFATIEEDTLTELVQNIHFWRSKCQQIIKASNQIISDFDGEVPETEKELLKLSGIGVKFANLLNFVNTPENHINYLNNYC